MTWLQFTLGALSTYRLCRMLSAESGPGRIFKKLRGLPEKGSATKEGLACPHCSGVYFAALVTGFFIWRESIELADSPIYWLAFSGSCTILTKLLDKPEAKK